MAMATMRRSGVVGYRPFLSAFALLASRAGAVPEQRPTNVEDLQGCQCSDPITGDGCYQPVCPPGYFKCCATCSEAPCFGTDKLFLSWRGLPECIECEPGDFCPGCDTFVRCPMNEQEGREGPRISKTKATGIGDCESCSLGLEASFDRSACMMKYTDVCNSDVVSRCIRNCKAADPVRGKHLTACERMKCTMFCAKRWSEPCREAVSEYCLFSTTLAAELPDGIEAEEGQGDIVGCDVDCNAALPRSPRAFAATLFATLALSVSAGVAPWLLS